jgi:hypothetical protein
MTPLFGAALFGVIGLSNIAVNYFLSPTKTETSGDFSGVAPKISVPDVSGCRLPCSSIKTFCAKSPSSENGGNDTACMQKELSLSINTAPIPLNAVTSFSRTITSCKPVACVIRLETPFVFQPASLPALISSPANLVLSIWFVSSIPVYVQTLIVSPVLNFFSALIKSSRCSGVRCLCTIWDCSHSNAIILDCCTPIIVCCARLSDSSEKKSAVVNSGSINIPNNIHEIAIRLYAFPPSLVSQYMPQPPTIAPSTSPYSSHVFNGKEARDRKILHIVVLLSLSFPAAVCVYAMLHATITEGRKERRIQEILRNWRGLP